MLSIKRTLMSFGDHAVGCLVSLHGVCDGKASLEQHLSQLRGTVILDLDDVSRITSDGIRRWMESLAAVRAEYYAFIRCRPGLMVQFNMIANFGGRGDLLSFYLPYSCERCGDFEILVDLRFRHDVTHALQAPEMTCPRCNEPAEFDEVPELYLGVCSSALPPAVPNLANQIIDGSIDAAHLEIRKEVHPDLTALWLSGSLSCVGKSSRWLQDIEGPVLMDLAGVRCHERVLPPATDELLRYCGDDAIFIANAAPELLPPLTQSRAVSLVSTLLHAYCEQCESQVRCSVSAEAIRATRGSRVSAMCPLCNALLSIQLPSPVPEMRLATPEEVVWNVSHEGSSSPAAKPSPPARDLPVPDEVDAAGEALLFGESAAFRAILERVGQVALSEATVLLRGETGTGKETLAKRLHLLSARASGPFVPVNCAAFADGLVESELFGHEQGAFTGARSRKIGRFELANGGTLFIDEVGDLPASTQVKLLRAVQERYIERVGGSDPIPVDIRLVAATNQDLEELMEHGRFRRDLYYRLNVVPMFLPPLRERHDDILALAEAYLKLIQERAGKRAITLSRTARDQLIRHRWPGNVRELMNVIERAVALSSDGARLDRLEIEPTPSLDTAPAAGDSLRSAVNRYERSLIVDALERANGNRTLAARALGLSRQALGHKLTKHGL